MTLQVDRPSTRPMSSPAHRQESKPTSELAYVNGRFMPIAEAMVSIEDRGLQFADSVYEVIVAYASRLFMPNEHLARLKRSAAAIELSYDFEQVPLLPILEEGVTRTGRSEVMAYVQMTRGSAPRSHVVRPGLSPTVLMTFRNLPEIPESVRRSGVSVVTERDVRWANCSIKSTMLLPSILARLSAERMGADDAVFVNAQGEILECTSSNVFVVGEGVIRTPPLTESILHGITQQFVKSCAASLGIEVVHAPLTVSDLMTADEAFQSSTTLEVMGITRVDGRPIGGGKVGPVTQRLFAEFRRGTGRPLIAGEA